MFVQKKSDSLADFSLVLNLICKFLLGFIDRIGTVKKETTSRRIQEHDRNLPINGTYYNRSFLAGQYIIRRNLFSWTSTDLSHFQFPFFKKRLNQCCGSVNVYFGSGSADP
jgi:hypothetical protein